MFLVKRAAYRSQEVETMWSKTAYYPQIEKFKQIEKCLNIYVGFYEESGIRNRESWFQNIFNLKHAPYRIGGNK